MSNPQWRRAASSVITWGTINPPNKPLTVRIVHNMWWQGKPMSHRVRVACCSQTSLRTCVPHLFICMLGLKYRLLFFYFEEEKKSLFNSVQYLPWKGFILIQSLIFHGLISTYSLPRTIWQVQERSSPLLSSTHRLFCLFFYHRNINSDRTSLYWTVTPA